MRLFACIATIFRHSKESRAATIIGWLAMIICILSASATIPLAKHLSTHLSPLSIIFLSEAIALIVTVLSCGLIPLLRTIVALSRSHLVALIILGICNSFVAPMVVFKGLQSALAIHTELFLRTDTLFLFLFAYIFLHERIEKTHIYAIAAIFFGIVLVAFRGFTEPFVFRTGEMLVLVGALFYSIGNILYKKYLSDVDSTIVIFTRGTVAVLLFFIISPFLVHNFLFEIRAFPVALIGVLISYGIITRFFNLFSFYEAMERLSMQTISLLLPLITVGSIAFAYMYLGEHIYWFHIVGTVLIVFGSVIMQLSHKQIDVVHLEKHLNTHQPS